MEKFIAVDAGKKDSKICVYDGKTTNIYGFKTKIDVGYFEDDALEQDTFISQIGDKVYKIGNGAETEAELETNKQTEVHKVCLLSAIAMCCSDNEVDDVYVAIGIPLSDYNDVLKRNEFREYMLNEETYTISVKMRSDSPVKTKTFNIKKKFVYPEGSGGLFVDGIINYTDKTVGVIDLGWLNNNLAVYRAGDPDKKMSKTNELGGSKLVRGLATALSTKYSRVDEKTVVEILRLPSAMRCLDSDDAEIRESSCIFIHNYILNYVKELKRDMDDKGWALDYMKLVAIGGTALMFETELKEIFGEKLFIPKMAQFANVVGFMRMLYVRSTGEDKIIPMPEVMQIKTVEDDMAEVA